MANALQPRPRAGTDEIVMTLEQKDFANKANAFTTALNTIAALESDATAAEQAKEPPFVFIDEIKVTESEPTEEPPTQ